ncbi:Plant protein 1589 of unknown function [Arabidopsis thaliana]|uniref:Uncharacterized protein n=2 Tax=Arabidopsis thaliana TaxID=3702 RepID=F4ISC4_ARATH|nr:Plant protein 1589 of unknown function [Arabidopsis thaliana]AEC06177.1 Plant protein 1589 of unknown function [Arabidopsis thaliana]|eukprot:NP_671831.1 Plant protein 1589 of unknown function [Arabidopsis thaliana]
MGKGSITETLVEARLGRGWRRYGWSEAANRGSELRWSLPVGARSPVKNLIETCIYKYMSLEETETYVEDNHKISHHLTKPIWEQLQKESPEFFKKYYFLCELARQIVSFS